MVKLFTGTVIPMRVFSPEHVNLQERAMLKMADFPLIKLGSLVIKQVFKSLAKFIRNRATSSPFFRTYICMPPAHGMYNW